MQKSVNCSPYLFSLQLYKCICPALVSCLQPYSVHVHSCQCYLLWAAVMPSHNWVPRPGAQYTGGLVLMDLILRAVMTCEDPRGLQHVPICDFSEAWHSKDLTLVNQSLSLCRA